LTNAKDINNRYFFSFGWEFWEILTELEARFEVGGGTNVDKKTTAT